MPQEDLELAASLIKQKKYTQARAILNTIPNDPKAREWLARLDQIDPVFSTPVPSYSHQPISQQVVVQKEKGGGCIKTAFGVFAGMGAIGIVVAFCLVLVVCGIPTLILYSINANEEQATEDAIDRNAGFGSEEKPIPADRPMLFKNGEVRVTRINTDATRTVEQMNSFNSEPAAGSTFVLVYFEITCDKQNCYEMEFDFRLIDGKSDPWGESTFTVINDDLSGGAVRGGTLAGWQVFEFPQNLPLEAIKIEWDSETLYVLPPSNNETGTSPS